MIRTRSDNSSSGDSTPFSAKIAANAWDPRVTSEGSVDSLRARCLSEGCFVLFDRLHLRFCIQRRILHNDGANHFSAAFQARAEEEVVHQRVDEPF